MGEEPDAMTPATGQPGEPISPADEPTVIRAEIEQTRAEMSETIDAIQDRLRPQHIMEQAKETVRDATVGRIKDMASSVGETASGVATQVQEGAQQAVEYVRENPWPALLIGAGVTWMLLQGQRRPRRQMYAPMRYPGREPETWREGTPTTTGATGTAQRTVGDVTERVQEGWRRYSTRAETQFQRWMRENPLTVGAAAVALGAAVGLSAPRTETEDAWMGEARDTLVDRAQQAAEGAVEKAQQVVDVAQETVQGAQQAISGNEPGSTGSRA